ncbi:MAG: aminomethyl-transferring glycine dehydrogenase [Burkholderiales bacterium]|nr:aminomethyl-transferring glycine dehydrogenase [Burkholderiales bacterium]
MSDFLPRHIGPNHDEQRDMLRLIGAASLDDLLRQAVPPSIVGSKPLPLPVGLSEVQTLAELRSMAQKNQLFRNFIGQGYAGTITPPVILRNILENPAWYTAYTPYQPEISQGRLEALLNYQTMIADLTGMDIANASLLDEGTAAAEAMTLAKRQAKADSNTIIVASDCHPQTIDVLKQRAEPLGIVVKVGSLSALMQEGDYFAVLAQYPSTSGQIHDLAPFAEAAHARGALFICAADPLALMLLKAPGAWGADIVIGSTQRFGVPMGYGGPHAAYMAVRDAYKRNMPGRLVGVSIDAHGKPAYRLTLQTREQHIRREKATSNICTAQVLLAVIAGMYAVYHGPEGLRAIARRVHALAMRYASGLRAMGIAPGADAFFDTVTFTHGAHAAIIATARNGGMNLRHYADLGAVGVSFDETHTEADVDAVLFAVGAAIGVQAPATIASAPDALPAGLKRDGDVLAHPVFNTHHSETEMLRYLRRLADRDLALDRTMIPLGSCTMKLNATTEMIPITWPEFGNLHPFVPAEQARGYAELTSALEAMLCRITGFDAVSLQPNSGAQGEYAGLLAIRAYHQSRGDHGRVVCLIPASAHGTNPASAQMCGMEVVVTKCDADGNVDVADLRAAAEQHSARLAALMITYPSTHGVFEEAIKDICAIVHQHGGQVYMDGANLNAQVGVCYPAEIGADVSHMNLHKTFCIPHGGGGPGIGPIGVKAHLAPFLPGRGKVGPVSAAPFGSASILPIPYAYIRLMGADGLREATAVAILNANYIAKKLAPHYPMLYSGHGGFVAHECIVDVRPIKERCGISNMDVAKRLMDYGFHAPTVSFPVAGTLMIEPTESEPKVEIDRFIDAMIAIREEIRAVETGVWPKDDNPLVNAPHTAAALLTEAWDHAYTREQAAYPLAALREHKYWPPVGRVDDVYGDRNIMCSCPSLESYASA